MFIDRSEARRALLLTLILLGCLTAFVLAFARVASARDPQGIYTNAPHAAWFKQQHNSRGEWCCDESDGHEWYGDYTLNHDGSVTLPLNGEPHTIAAELVLKGANPTGHAVYWYRDTVTGRRDYCFAPGTLS